VSKPKSLELPKIVLTEGVPPGRVLLVSIVDDRRSPLDLARYAALAASVVPPGACGGKTFR
jgi:hypothetical protein